MYQFPVATFTTQMMPYNCAGCGLPAAQVTLTGIPADPFPKEALECWEVTREGDSEVRWVWKTDDPVYPWNGQYPRFDTPVGAVGYDWMREPWKLKWRRVR